MITSFLTNGVSFSWYSERNYRSVEAISLEDLNLHNRLSLLDTFQEKPIETTEPSTKDILLQNIDLYHIVKNILTPRQFKVFELRFIYGFNQFEISKVLDMKQPSVSMILDICKAKLRKKLKGIDALLRL